ncbi:hypothetical protein CH298_06570 [Rhodococcoides fascians]|uniref:hypothetical protein n=1 Tax=Rhodococcoides fascians TaxID=1828 RepID=UPI000B9BC5D6|nr:hypothetical protein [Rhodococcus fascians]OZE90846.1 hypothetical protein CH303_06550 [Rhodococcus fascians]OZF20533.1 hypothetical protein CH298_06570 [Rhodococcus fascians]OZF23534.1 hypothetical protein CH297_06560 [Rhodococcus fascians]OZF71154.1 hypothetical protein CH308_06365 [Rhodococcus fascians]OZF72741.1 hypothetical protein CH307_06370 [Rhodococcus fascians]
MTEQPGGASIGAPDVGLYLDDEQAVAAVSHPIAPGPSLHLASLHSTVLNTHPDGTVSLGDATDNDSEAYTHFLDSLGDGVAGSRGTVFPAEQLTSMALLCLLTEVASSIDLRPGDLAAAATYPARWTAEQVFALRAAMNGHGLAHVALVSEEEALDAWNSSMRATMEKKDTAVAAARGAALLAARYPVDAVTERLAVVGAPTRADRRPLFTAPLFAAAAFAAALTVGAGVIALQLGTSADTPVPTIENAQVAPPTTTSGIRPGGPIDFPTAVVEPAAELVPAVPPAPIITPETTTTATDPTRERRSERDAADVDTRPAVDLPEATETEDPTTTPPTDDEPVGPELPDDDTAEDPPKPTPDENADDNTQAGRLAPPQDRAPAGATTGGTP